MDEANIEKHGSFFNLSDQYIKAYTTIISIFYTFETFHYKMCQVLVT